MTNKN